MGHISWWGWCVSPPPSMISQTTGPISKIQAPFGISHAYPERYPPPPPKKKEVPEQIKAFPSSPKQPKHGKLIANFISPGSGIGSRLVLARDPVSTYMANFGFAPGSGLGLMAQSSAQYGSAQPGVRLELARGSAIRSGHIAWSMAQGSARLGS